MCTVGSGLKSTFLCLQVVINVLSDLLFASRGELLELCAVHKESRWCINGN